MCSIHIITEVDFYEFVPVCSNHINAYIYHGQSCRDGSNRELAGRLCGFGIPSNSVLHKRV